MKAGRTRVLIVEDEQDIAGLIKHALEREAAVEVEIAGSGDAALKAVTEDVPDLVILDLNLPVLSGVEVCRIMRGRPDTAKVPIIMLTARSTESDRIAGLDVGADLPVPLVDLVACLAGNAEFLAQRHHRLALEQPGHKATISIDRPVSKLLATDAERSRS